MAECSLALKRCYAMSKPGMSAQARKEDARCNRGGQRARDARERPAVWKHKY